MMAPKTKVSTGSLRAIVKPKVAAAVLCGGRGERLRPLTDFFQKTMVPIGPKKRPLLEYIIRLFAFHGVKDITLLTGYRTEEIRAYFRDGSAFGVNLRYSKDPNDAMGSLNAVANALDKGYLPSCDVLVVYYGDVLSDLALQDMISLHGREKADATLVLARGYQLPVGVATVKSKSRVVAMKEKPTLDISITTGCMVLGPKAMKLALAMAGGGRNDLMTHFVPELLKRRAKVGAFYTKGLWYDVGTVASYEKLNLELRDDMLPFMAKPSG